MIDYKKLYEYMDRQYPLKNRDCGRLCNKACCSNDDEKTGMYLFPGEEVYFKGSEWYEIEKLTKEEAGVFPFDYSIIYKLICNGKCERDKRPLACRIFPTAPRLHENGVFNIVFDIHAFLMCPLAKDNNIRKLDSGYLSSCRKVWNELLKNQILYDRYLYESRLYDDEINSPWFKLMLGK